MRKVFTKRGPDFEPDYIEVDGDDLLLNTPLKTIPDWNVHYKDVVLKHCEHHNISKNVANLFAHTGNLNEARAALMSDDERRIPEENRAEWGALVDVNNILDEKTVVVRVPRSNIAYILE